MSGRYISPQWAFSRMTQAQEPHPPSDHIIRPQAYSEIPAQSTTQSSSRYQLPPCSHASLSTVSTLPLVSSSGPSAQSWTIRPSRGDQPKSRYQEIRPKLEHDDSSLMPLFRNHQPGGYEPSQAKAEAENDTPAASDFVKKLY